MIGRKRGPIRLRPEHAEHTLSLRMITLAMSWSSGVALGIATGDIFISILLSVVITAGHVVSWRTRMWRSAKWQIILLVPTSFVAILLVSSLPQAFQGDWLHPMRYMLLLQALTSFYLHSRASLYTAQVLSGIVLLVSSQLSFDSLFLFFFFTFFLLQLIFLSVATKADALSGSIGASRWPGAGSRVLWTSGGVGALAIASLAAFLLLPWGSITVAGSGSSMMPLTGEALEGGNGDADVEPTPLSEIRPLSGPESTVGDEPQQAPEEPGQGPESKPLGGEGQGDGVGAGLGGSLSEGSPTSPLFGSQDGAGGGIVGETGPMGDQANPMAFQVRSPVSTYWRGQTYSLYDGNQWLPDQRVEFSPQARSQRHRYAQTFFARSELETPVFGYTPLGWQPVGDTTAPSIHDGDVYRVISERRNFFPGALLRAPNAYIVNRGPDAMIPRSVRDLAGQITMGHNSALEKSLAITQYIRSNYKYIAAVEPWHPAQTLEQFLFGDHKLGNAFDFASAQTALAVSAGLEARMVTGYLPGDLDPLSGTYVVRASEAHAWTEVNFRGSVGWVPFDGNPREDGQARTPVQRGAAGAIAGLFNQRIGDKVREGVKVAVEQTVSFGSKILIPGAMAIGVISLLFAVRWFLRRRKTAISYSLLADADRRALIVSYEKLMRKVCKHVSPRRSDETIDQYFGRVAQAFPSLWQELVSLREVINRAAYEPSADSQGFSVARARVLDLRKAINSATRA